MAALLPAERAERRLAAVLFLAAATVPLLGPLAGTSRRAVASTLAAAVGLLLAALPASLLAGGAPLASLAAGSVLAGFLLLLAGIAAGLQRLSGNAAAAVAASAAAGILALASFHVGDPFLEWRAGGHSAFALTALHLANPLSGAVGSALSLDWLRLPILYSGFPGSGRGGVSAAQYYAYSYTPWWAAALLYGLPGAALLAFGRGSD